MNHSEALPVRKAKEKKKVLRKEKVEERLLARIRERVDGDSAFQREGPIEVKDRDWAIAVLVWGTRSSSLFDERSGRWEEAERGRSNTSAKYFGARPLCALKTRMMILNLMRAERGSQCSCSNMKVEMWEYRGRRAINLAAAFRTDWRGERRTLGRPMRRELQ